MKMSINIVGGGKVGKVLAHLFAIHDVFLIQDVLNRSPDSSQQAIKFIGAGTPVASIQAMRSADVYMLSVPDDQIVQCCAELARCGHLQPDSIVFHCSGALASLDLTPAIGQGAAVASVHPVRSFADIVQVAQHFAGTFCSLEGEPRATELLAAALSGIGARPIAIDASAKTLYHAASVFACNYLVTLIDLALQTYTAAGIPPDMARQLAEPLVTETVSNIFRLGPEKALTGPIARGDMATVAKQQRAVSAWDAQSGASYQVLAEATIKLAQRKMAG